MSDLAVLELILVPVGVIGIPSVVIGLAFLWRAWRARHRP